MNALPEFIFGLFSICFGFILLVYPNIIAEVTLFMLGRGNERIKTYARSKQFRFNARFSSIMFLLAGFIMVAGVLDSVLGR